MHKKFKLQGESFNNSYELLEFSKRFSPEIYEFFKKWFDVNSYVEVKTSGSTGRPKVIRLQKIYMINSAVATGIYFNIHENSSALLCMSPNFIAGKMMLVRALVLGWCIDVVDPVANPLKECKKLYDFSAMVPLQLLKSLSDLHKVKKLIVGGGIVSNELLRKIQNCKTKIFATYGMTETVTHIAVKKLNQFSQTELGSASHFTILPDISISLDDRKCLVIDAPKVSDAPVVTNDLVEIISASKFKWLGRIDTIINSAGIKLIPEQIEQKLDTIIKQRFFVIGREDEVFGEKLVLIIEGFQNEELQNKVRNLKFLSKFEIPKEIYFIEKFKETPTKKVDRLETLKLL